MRLPPLTEPVAYRGYTIRPSFAAVTVYHPTKGPCGRFVSLTAAKRWIEGLRKRRAELDLVYERQVLARHPDWTPEKQKQQLAVLQLKWLGANRTSEDDTVNHMRRFGSQRWDSELVDDDYRDTHRAISEQWRIDDEIEAAKKQLARLRAGW